MLLLVLILVLIAFGLLVVALLSGSVLWAWVSVGVSVAAAAVLLVDWLQRRSAVRAGAGQVTPRPAVPSQGRGPGAGRRAGHRGHSRDRATTPPRARGGDEARRWAATNGGRCRRRSSCRRWRRPALRRDRRALAAVSAVEPSWSQSVTNVERPDGRGRPRGRRSPGRDTADPDAEDTVKVTGTAPEAPPRDEPASAPPVGSPPVARPEAGLPRRPPAAWCSCLRSARTAPRRRSRATPMPRRSSRGWTTRCSSSTSCRAITSPGAARSRRAR